MIKRIMVLGLSLFAAAGVSPVSATDQGARHDTRQIIVRLKDDGVRRIQAARRNEAVAGISLPDGTPLTFVRPFDGNGMVVRLPKAVSLQEAQAIAARLVASGSVASAQADKRMYPTRIPEDPGYLLDEPPLLPGNIATGQWNLFDVDGGIRMESGWDRETGSAAGIIAQLDTGFVPHRDIEPNRVLDGYDFFSGTNNTVDRDGEPGRDADPTDPGDWIEAGDPCFVDSPVSSSWHGLSVASIMVAESDNFVDITGIDFAAKLLPIRVLGTCGGNVSDVLDAIRWAAGLPVAGVPDNPDPARILNLSLSGKGACLPEEQAAINDAVFIKGAVVIVSAGNDEGEIAKYSPANCQNVVVVGATLRDDSRAPYANTGEKVDLSAPGGLARDSNDIDGILVLSNTGTTVAGLDTIGRIAGSSFSTAQVSAVASLMLATNSSLTSGQIREILRRTTRAFPDVINSCNTSLCGSGILDADAALAGAADPASVLGATVNSSGGCSVAAATASGFDPLFLLFVAFAASWCWQRRKHASLPAR